MVPPIILVIYDRIISTPSGESGLWLIVLILYSYHLSYKNKLRFELKCTISNWYSTNDFRLEESISMLRFSTSRSTKILIVPSKLIHFVRKLICENETLPFWYASGRCRSIFHPPPMSKKFFLTNHWSFSLV